MAVIPSTVIVNAVAGSYARTMPLSYAFAPAGEAVEKSGYTGGSDYTSAWTEDEKDNFRAMIARYGEVANLTIVEVDYTVSHAISLQMVDAVPGGWAGYAGGSIFVVGSASESLLTHEFGHSLSLGHPFDTSQGSTILPGVASSSDPGPNGFNAEFYSVMAYRTGEVVGHEGLDTALPQSLMVLDIAALQLLYGANMSTRAGDDTYGVTDRFDTIWDADGDDWIDFFTARTDTLIDLRAATLLEEPGGAGYASLIDRVGALSYPYGEAPGGYFIAYGATIENGRGGSGDDLVIGNEVANLLDGSIGDDTMRGGAGNDMLLGQGTGGDIPTTVMTQVNADALGDGRLEAAALGGLGPSFTISFTLRIDPEGAGHDQTFLSYTVGTGSREIELRAYGDTGNVFVIESDDAGSNSVWTGMTVGEFDDGGFHHIALAFDAVSGKYTFWLDTVQQYQGATERGQAIAAGGTLVFGQTQGIWGPAMATNWAYEGQIGDIAVMNRAATQAEIDAGALNQLVALTTPGLTHYWSADAAGSYSDLVGSVALGSVQTDGASTVALASDNDSLSGGTGHDTLNGGAGDDTLDGGAGLDLMIGGVGSDVFYVDNVGDRVAESRKWAGTDTVISSVDFRTGNRHIENVELTGTARIGAGNGLMNVITGNDVDNILDGGKNNDTLIGGLGNDTYLLRAPGDTAVELAGQGIDIAKSYGSFALMAHVEKLFMQTVFSKQNTPVNFNGIGNGLDNTIIGTPFDNTIVGREGRDVLKGQAGDDTFVFDRALGADNVDRIIDFEVNGDNDTLKIKGVLLGGMSAGVLAAGQFVAGTAAGDANDRFIFDRPSGQLWFDADGTGAAAQQLVATFEQNALVQADDILIF